MEGWDEKGMHRKAHDSTLEKITRYKIRYGLELDEDLEYSIIFHKEYDRIRKYYQRKHVQRPQSQRVGYKTSPTEL
jgi:hypothetical protein